MNQVDSSILTPRAVAARVGAFSLFGLGAGVVLFAIEAIDRLAVLDHSIDGPGEALQLVLLMGATVLGAGVVGLALGLVAAPLEVVRQVAARLLSRVPRLSAGPLLDAVSVVAAAVAVAAVLKFVSGQFPDGLELSVHRLVLRYNDRISAIPFVVAYWKALYTTVIFLFALAIMWAQVWIFGPKRAWSWILAAAVVVVSAVALAWCYQFDSRAYFARYEWTIHYPLVTGYTVMTTLAVGYALRVVTSMRWGISWDRRATAATLALAALGLGCYGYAAVAMDANQNVKALFWNRSVIARRVFEVSRRLVDRDRDGYSPAFGGGDLDDRNPAVHLFAPEIAGNGVDDNCIGGDLAVEDAASRPRTPVPGEFVDVAVAAQPPFEPKAVPAGAFDVASPEAVATGAAAERPNVVIITIDCLRQDHTTMHGYHRDTTPNIDRYGRQGLVFLNAIPHGTNTGHSFAAMLRSSYMEAIFDRGVPTLTQSLEREGYHSAFVNARRLDDWLTPRRWHRYRPTMIGDFNVLHLDGEEREWTADELTDATISYLDRQPKGHPQFLWVHYMDVHWPREGHPEYGFGTRDVDVYDAEVKYADAAVGRLLDHMKATGVLDRSIVFISADHGEAFLEHGTRDHSNKPYADNSHVPLVVLAPGVEPKRIDTVVGMIDIAPTALAFAGLPVPNVYRGIDLVGAARAGAVPHRVIVSETPRNGIETSFFAWGYIDWPYKLVYDIRGNTTELYNMADDPSEQRNLVERDPERAAAMRAALGRWLDLETVGPSMERATR